MHRGTTTGPRTTLALATLVFAVSGCQTSSDWLKGRRTAEPADIAIDAPMTNPYLTEMQDLVTGDPATQAEIYADAQSTATLTPGASTKLRYAMVLATAGHPGTDAAEAQSLLRDVLSQREMMTADEIALATVYLNNVEDRIVLESEARRLRASTTRAATSEEEAIARRIAAVEAENRQLQLMLEDAEAKIEALSSIERSIRSQTDNGAPQ